MACESDQRILVSIKIVCGSRVFPFKIEKYLQEDTLREIYKKRTEQETSLPVYEDSYLQCYISKDQSTLGQPITEDASAKDAIELFGRFVTFKVNTPHDGNTSAEGSTNLFETLMAGRSKPFLPKKHTHVINKKIELYNEFIQDLSDNGVGFPKSVSDKLAKEAVTVITNIIWSVDPHHGKFISRACHIPQDITKYFGKNNPTKTKHKRSQLKMDTLNEHCQEIENLLMQPFFSNDGWAKMKQVLSSFSEAIFKYYSYLKEKLNQVKENAASETVVRDPLNNREIKHLDPIQVISPAFREKYNSLNTALENSDLYTPISVDTYTHDMLPRERRTYIENLPKAVSHLCTCYKVAYGNNLGTMNFIWRSEIASRETETIKVIDSIPLQVFHSRAMRKLFIQKCTLMTNEKRPAVLRYLYRELTGDCSGPSNETEQEIDDRVQQAFEMEDVGLVIDLRRFNSRPDHFEVFLDAAETYINNVVETAVCDRRHNLTTHMATAISLNDLHSEISKTCPEGTPIPSSQWLYWQFAPRNPAYHSAQRHTGKLNVRYAVQSRQLRAKHEDSHYAAALFKYLREFAVKYRDHATLVCEDDKHHVKVGEPGVRVAAAERGRRVITTDGVQFTAADHDFTKFSVIPSVLMIVDIPDNISNSFYRGQVYVGLKDLALEPSTPLRHAAELQDCLDMEHIDKPILLLYTDGGPDHRCTYLSVQMAMLCLFLSNNYDMLVLMRTPPKGSWMNPPERVMPLLNRALQCVGLERSRMEDCFEKAIKSTSTQAGLRQKAASDPNLKEAILDSIHPVKVPT